MRAPPLNNRGQFIPITAMVAFTTMVFLVAVVNIYKVSKAKLQVQNLADAAALNIASQMASSMNKVADLNEWLNHAIQQAPGAPSIVPGDIPDCTTIPDKNFPPLSCLENNMFQSVHDAAAYAKLVQMINKSQDLFQGAYNNFIGSGLKVGGGNLQSILFGDIPDLKRADTYTSVWNTQPTTVPPPPTPNSPPLEVSGMSDLQFTTKDVMVGYWLDSARHHPEYRTLGQALAKDGGNPNGVKIGWKELTNLPRLQVKTAKGMLPRIGAGARVTRDVPLVMFGASTSFQVSAVANAFVVEGSGRMGGAAAEMKPDRSGMLRPVFKPTYWVKLAEVKP